MKKIVLLMALTIFVKANDEVDINELLNSIKNTPLDKRYEKMNQLKKILKRQKSGFRREVLMKLQSSNSIKPPIDHHIVDDRIRVDIYDKADLPPPDIKIDHDIDFDDIEHIKPPKRGF
jgi:hypothetical protein